MESSQEANAQTVAHWIEQRRITARNEVVKDAQTQAAKSAATAAGLSVAVGQLRTEATKLAARIDAAKHASGLATSVRSKTAGADTAVLASMFGDIAVEAKRYAGIVDERYTIGMMCEHICDPARESNNSSTASQQRGCSMNAANRENDSYYHLGGSFQRGGLPRGGVLAGTGQFLWSMVIIIIRAIHRFFKFRFFNNVESPKKCPLSWTRELFR